MVSAEVGAAYPHEPERAERAILSGWQDAASVWLPTELQPPDWSNVAHIGQALRLWAQKSIRPIVLFIDEIDALQDEALIVVLRQLRDVYPRRPGGFPHSLALIGLRDVRDYKVAAAGSHRSGTATPFNIKIRSLTLRNFNVEEVADLYAQHTSVTGQQFRPETIQLVFDLTQGQPWLVNALAKEVVEALVTDSTISITPAHIQTVKEILIKDPLGGITIANPIYREVLPRVLTVTPMASLPQIAPTWLKPDGALDPDTLLNAFLAFWKQHGEPLLGSASYHEIAPHLVMMAFLHRVVNGSGTLEREYAIGRDRMDLCLRYGDVTLAIELKVQRDRGPNQVVAGLEQIERYLERLPTATGWLMIFDRRQDAKPIADRLFTELKTTPKGLPVTVIYG